MGYELCGKRWHSQGDGGEYDEDAQLSRLARDGKWNAPLDIMTIIGTPKNAPEVGAGSENSSMPKQYEPGR